MIIAVNVFCYIAVINASAAAVGQFVIAQFNKPITFKVVVQINQSQLWFNSSTIKAFFFSLLMQIFPFFHNLAILLFSKIVIFMIN